MIKARIVTQWAVNEDGEYYPEFLDHYPHKVGERSRDVTVQPVDNIPPTPNAYTLEVTLHEDTFTELEADPRYIVLWSEAE